MTKSRILALSAPILIVLPVFAQMGGSNSPGVTMYPYNGYATPAGAVGSSQMATSGGPTGDSRQFHPSAVKSTGDNFKKLIDALPAGETKKRSPRIHLGSGA